MRKSVVIMVILLFFCKITFCQNIESALIDPDIKILSEYAKRNDCLGVSYAKFRDKCIYLFGIDVDDYQNEDMNIIVDRTEYSISKQGLLLKTFPESLFYQPWIEGTVTEQQAKSMLADSDNGIAEKFIAYNKLLFYDDLSAESYFEVNPESAIDIVLNLNYETSERVLASAIKQVNGFIEYDIEKILFYNNKKRGFREKIISSYYNTHNSSVQDLQPFTEFIRKFSKQFSDLPHPQSLKDSCMVHLVKLLIDFDNKHMTKAGSIKNNLSYIYLSIFLKSDTKLYARMRANNALSNTKITELLDDYNLLHFANCSIQDPDGYTNLREGVGINTPIIKPLKTAESVTVIDCNGNWILVKTRNGIIGYVHRSRLKSSTIRK